MKKSWQKFTIKCKDEEKAKEVAEMLKRNTLVRNVTTYKNLAMYEQMGWESER